ncbi:MFS transporter [Rhodobacteraceae bacterium CYK-10]|uniref:MFS transporter n=2 Tax=Stagnihabitans tardus TaxID=2699202 RepID=A0AAE4YB83_9RHOB|nr:MFS transporter [Stagnihabitans tardus]
MALCAGTLVASEFLPVALLTPIARDLGITEGQAGQAISVSGLFAVVTSLMITGLVGALDRKRALGLFALAMVVSGIVVTLAPNYPVLMAGRALLGVAVGGFWSLSASVVMRVAGNVPRGLAALNAGVALSSILAAPLGASVEHLWGWRVAFFVLVPLAGLALWGLARHLPALPVRPAQKAPLGLLAQPHIALGMGSTCLFFLGQFALFTYLRPHLEARGSDLSLTYLSMGLAGLAGTWVVARALPRLPYALLIGIPAVMAVLALGLLAGLPTLPLLILWSFAATGAPVGWGAWMTRALGAQAEAGGGLQVAVIQAAIMGGAAVGGLVFDAAGVRATFMLAVVALLAASLLAALTHRTRRD